MLPKLDYMRTQLTCSFSRGIKKGVRSLWYAFANSYPDQHAYFHCGQLTAFYTTCVMSRREGLFEVLINLSSCLENEVNALALIGRLNFQGSQQRLQDNLRSRYRMRSPTKLACKARRSVTSLANVSARQQIPVCVFDA